jgi:hypothetical protein
VLDRREIEKREIEKREIEKREIKRRKPMHVLGLILVQVHALVSIFLFLSSLFLS